MARPLSVSAVTTHTISPICFLATGSGCRGDQLQLLCACLSPNVVHREPFQRGGSRGPPDQPVQAPGIFMTTSIKAPVALDDWQL